MAPLKALQTYLNPTATAQLPLSPTDVMSAHPTTVSSPPHHPMCDVSLHLRHLCPHHLTVYIGQTGPTARTLNQLSHNHRFLKHRSLAHHPNLSWQILQLLSPHFTTSSRTSTEPVTRMMIRLQKEHSTVTFTQDNEHFYRSFTSSTPLSLRPT